MPKRTESPFGTSARELIDQVRSTLVGKPEAMLDTASAVMAHRAKRLATSEARLIGRLGAEHPRVVDLTRRRVALEDVDRSLREQRKRDEDEQPLRPGEWLAIGRLVDERGEPLEGFQVVVLDQDTGPDDPLGDEVTNADGEWRAEYHERDFADEQGEAVPRLQVLVFDRSGKLVFETAEAVPANESRRNRFEIALTDRRLRSGVERRSCVAKTAAGKPCKNAARPGSELCRVHDPVPATAVQHERRRRSHTSADEAGRRAARDGAGQD